MQTDDVQLQGTITVCVTSASHTPAVKQLRASTSATAVQSQSKQTTETRNHLTQEDHHCGGDLVLKETETTIDSNFKIYRNRAKDSIYI